ncbi:MAG: cation diffusion facilitator family transporter [Gammaproteobacteria bacterium]|nr:cation diffusion facilitator family transporter [Gammaproteobacteria bacterium]
MQQHAHAADDYNRLFALGVTLNVIFVLVEAVAGFASNSMALLADAGHNLSDVLTLLLAWGAHALSGSRPTHRHTYGLRRSTILASLVSALVLYSAMGAMAWEAVGRLQSEAHVASGVVIGVAFVGMLVNGLTALLFARDRHRDLNIRGAFLHMAADAVVSMGVVVTGFLLLYTGWLWLDPAISLAIILVVLVSGWGLFRESLNLAVDAVPAHIDAAQVRDYLGKLQGVVQVHDLHIWAMSTTETALTAHLVMPELRGDADPFLVQTAASLREQFNIQHATLQIENSLEQWPCGVDCDPLAMTPVL